VVDPRARWDGERGGRSGERERERRRKGNRGAFHVTTIINGYIPASSHGVIFGAGTGAREREREREGERERGRKERAARTI